jgi:hypothetical protein
MSERPKYALEFVEFSPPTADSVPAMDSALAALEARGYSPVLAYQLSGTNGESEVMIVVEKIAADGCPCPALIAALQ